MPFPFPRDYLPGLGCWRQRILRLLVFISSRNKTSNYLPLSPPSLFKSPLPLSRPLSSLPPSAGMPERDFRPTWPTQNLLSLVLHFSYLTIAAWWRFFYSPFSPPFWGVTSLWLISGLFSFSWIGTLFTHFFFTWFFPSLKRNYRLGDLGSPAGAPRSLF